LVVDVFALYLADSTAFFRVEAAKAALERISLFVDFFIVTVCGCAMPRPRDLFGKNRSENGLPIRIEAVDAKRFRTNITFLETHLASFSLNGLTETVSRGKGKTRDRLSRSSAPSRSARVQKCVTRSQTHATVDDDASTTCTCVRERTSE